MDMTTQAETTSLIEERYRTLRPRLLQLARCIASWNAADDILQDAFLKLSKCPPEKILNDGYWIATVRNAARDHNRRAAGRNETSLTTAPEPKTQQEDDDGEDFPRDVYANALDSLSPEERDVVVLKKLSGKSYAELIDRLGCSYGAVRKRLQRAFEKLRGQIAFELIQEGKYEELDRIRFKESNALMVSRLCRSRPAAIESLLHGLRNRELNKAVKNVVLVLSNLLPTGRSAANEVENRLVWSLESGNLYRGQKMYIADVLIDRRYRQHIYRVGRVFLSQMEHLEDRSTQRQLTAAEMSMSNPIDIFDVKAPVINKGSNLSLRSGLDEIVPITVKLVAV